MVEQPPKTFLSMARKINELHIALSKAEATNRNYQLEIDRLSRQLTEAKSLGYVPTASSLPVE